MLWRYAGSPATTGKELNFFDADEAGNWAVGALIWAQENGVMVGNNNAVDPKGNASRSHVAQMLKNSLENVLK